MDEMSERDEIIRKLNAAREEMRHAGPVHRRDLQKHIRRLRGQLIACDKKTGGQA